MGDPATLARRRVSGGLQTFAPVARFSQHLAQLGGAAPSKGNPAGSTPACASLRSGSSADRAVLSQGPGRGFKPHPGYTTPASIGVLAGVDLICLSHVSQGFQA